MKTSFKRWALSVSILFIAYSPFNLSQSVSGRVVAESGEPLSGVRVINLSFGEATTGEGGQFRIEPPSNLRTHVDGEQVFRFTRAGYRPITRVLTTGAAAIEVALQKTDSTSSTWTPQFCASTNNMMVGGIMAFTLPKAAKVKRGQDIDYSMAFVEYKGSVLRLGWGPTWSWGLPGPAFFKGISRVDERDLQFHPDIPIREYKGTRSNGKYFRWIGTLGETIEYEDASREAATFFDAILDTLCWTRRPYTGPLK